MYSSNGGALRRQNDRVRSVDRRAQEERVLPRREGKDGRGTEDKQVAE